MKTLLARLAPGFFATLGAIVLGFFCVMKAQNKTESAAPMAQAQAGTHGGNGTYASEAPVQRGQLLVCGACGAQLQAPQVVMVAAPVNQGFDGRAVYSPRPAAFATDAYYPEPAAERVVYVEREASPYAYAPAYYDRAACDPFGEIRVNPIPFYPGMERSRFVERPRIGREFVAPQHVHGRN